MHGKSFNGTDLVDFATYGWFCSSDMVTISAMCLFEGSKEKTIKNKLMVLEDNDVELLLNCADSHAELARDVWKHVNQQKTVLALVLSRPRNSHYVGSFVHKIRDRTFKINARDSNPASGANAQTYCECVKKLLIRCANVSLNNFKDNDALGLEFLVNTPPVWTSRQPPGSNSCGHYQAASCLLAAMGLLETHKLDNAFVERCRRYTLWQILKKDNLLPMPYHSSQLCSDACVKMSTRDVFVKQITDGDKDAECRPAYAGLNNLAPGTKLRFECGQMWCDRVLVNVERFATFIEALQRAGVERCLPGYKGGAKDAAEYYYGLHPDYKFLERKYGVVVLYLADPKEFADHETAVKCDNTCTSRITKPANRKKPPITKESPTNTKKSSPVVNKTPPITKSSPITKEFPTNTKKSPIIVKSSPIVTKTSTITNTNTNTNINANTNAKANADSNTNANVNGDTNTNTNEFEDLGWDDECVKQLILGEKKAITHFKKNNTNANTDTNASTNTTNNTNTNANTKAKANNGSNTSRNTNVNTNVNADTDANANTNANVNANTNTNTNEFEDLGWDDECVKQLILEEKKAIVLFKKDNADININARTNTNNTSSITNVNTNVKANTDSNVNANADTKKTNTNEFDDECVKQPIWGEKKTITLLNKNSIANTNINSNTNTNARTNNTNNTSSNTNAKANIGSNTNVNGNVNTDANNTNTNEFEDLGWDDECVKQLILGEKKAIALFKKNKTNANTNTKARTYTNTSSNTNVNVNANAGTNTNEFADLDWIDECVNPPSVTKNLTRPSANVLTVRAAITPTHTTHIRGRAHTRADIHNHTHAHTHSHSYS